MAKRIFLVFLTILLKLDRKTQMFVKFFKKFISKTAAQEIVFQTAFMITFVCAPFFIFSWDWGHFRHEGYVRIIACLLQFLMIWIGIALILFIPLLLVFLRERYLALKKLLKPL